MKIHLLVPVLLGAAGCAAPTSSSASIGLPSGTVFVPDDIVVVTDGPVRYRRDVHVDGAGRMSVVYVRETLDGGRVTVDRAEYESYVQPTLGRIDEVLPETCAAWIEGCPAIQEEVARLVEGGATFRGGTHTGVVGPYFWCEPQVVAHEVKGGDERELVDPLDTLAVFLVVGDEALDGVVPGTRSPERRAYAFAERVLRTVELLRAESDCLRLGLVATKASAYGETFRRWSDAVDRAGCDVDRLTEILLQQSELSAWE